MIDDKIFDLRFYLFFTNHATLEVYAVIFYKTFYKNIL